MTTPTATIFVPYHAVDDLLQQGLRAEQPAASAVVPGTLYSVTDAGFRIEQSDGAVWTLYAPTGGGGGGGVPDPHHATHEPGGSDALVDAAWTDVANVFVADQTIDGDLFVTGTIHPLTDAQRDRINALIGEEGGARTLMSSSFVSGLSLRHDEAVARGRIACGNYDTQTYQPLALEVEALEVHTGVSPAGRVEHLRVHPLGGVTVGVGADHATDPGEGILQARGLGTTPLHANQLATGTVPDARLSANVQLKPLPPTPPTAHHATHEPGGSDALTGYFLPANVATIHRRGLRASQPAAASVVAGTLYCVTDERFHVERSTGIAWELWTPRRHVAMFSYDFSAAITEPPGLNQVRLNAGAPYTAVTKVWIRLVTTDGRDVYYGLMGTDVGTLIRIQDQNDHTIVVSLTLTAPPIDKTTYVEWPVTYLSTSGAALNGGQAVLVIKQ